MSENEEDGHVQDTNLISLEEMKKITLWLGEKGNTPVHFCPWCDNPEWTTYPYLYVNRIMGLYGMAEKDIGFPLVKLGCTNCAYVMFFDAYRMGVLRKKT